MVENAQAPRSLFGVRRSLREEIVHVLGACLGGLLFTYATIHPHPHSWTGWLFPTLGLAVPAYFITRWLNSRGPPIAEPDPFDSTLGRDLEAGVGLVAINHDIQAIERHKADHHARAHQKENLQKERARDKE